MSAFAPGMYVRIEEGKYQGRIGTVVDAQEEGFSRIILFDFGSGIFRFSDDILVQVIQTSRWVPIDDA